MILLLIGTCAFASCEEPLPDAIYLSWLQIETEQSSEDLQHTYQQLLTQARQLSEADPQNAQYLALSGIIKSHYASQVGGLAGLNIAKQAKQYLQQALSMDPKIFSGIAYAELGNLYHQTPHWPFSFGSDKMAEKLFQKALEINPQSLLSNLYFARYWYEQHEYSLAKGYLAAAISIKTCDGLSFCSCQLLSQANKLYQLVLTKTPLNDH